MPKVILMNGHSGSDTSLQEITMSSPGSWRFARHQPARGPRDIAPCDQLPSRDRISDVSNGQLTADRSTTELVRNNGLKEADSLVIYAPVDKIIGGKPSRVIDFLIADNEEKTLKCTVWNEHVVVMLPFYNAYLKEPLIVVLQLCRAKVVNGEVRITSSYDATKLHFNSSFDEFIESKSKLLSAIHSPVRSMSTVTVLSQSTGLSDFRSGAVVVSTISNLLLQKEDGDFYVAAEILGIEGSGRWYYIFCITAGCNKKLKNDEKYMICKKCEKQYAQGTVRYKIIVRVIDKTGDAPFLLWDREVAELVGILAKLLHEKYKKENQILVELESLIAFTVMKLSRDELLVSTYCQKLNDDQEKDLMSKMIEDDEGEDEESEMVTYLRL
ncbi:uncharacterized protein LOC116029849 [Ipomoea triloba]|uniref:uncharacterized protein LOC116029849 n=1 Tax=Ipomoea triloba TaxID=35885 RepID=UPI00125D341F|nr:uncharacterized protein LOC116029849 [Ipomoea triloba]